VLSRSRVSRLFIVSTPAERRWWTLLSIVAGTTEELTWRGVQPALLAWCHVPAGAAIAICAATFGVGHLAQGWKWAVAVFGFALAFHALTWVTGSLIVPMAVHVAVDLTGGVLRRVRVEAPVPSGRTRAVLMNHREANQPEAARV